MASATHGPPPPWPRPLWLSPHKTCEPSAQLSSLVPAATDAPSKAMAQSPLLLLLLLLLLPAVLAAPSSALPPCPAECQQMRCPPHSPQACLAVGGELQLDSCGCCLDCAPGEGQPCAPDGVCARGFFCYRQPGSSGPGTCSCVEGPLGVCGSDGRTYSSLCQLRARNHQSSSGHQPLVVPVHKGNCGDAGGCGVHVGWGEGRGGGRGEN